MAKPPDRPMSPHLQVYRPQLTSVLSFAHRLTGLTLGLYSITLVAWLIAAAAGPQVFFSVQTLIGSALGQILLFAGTFSLFLHLCGGVRHLFWDSGRGFELRTIYASGWAVVAVSLVLTLLAWGASYIVVN